MSYFIDNYFASRDFGIDEATGLTKQIRAVGLDIDAKTETIKVHWELCLVSPTNAVMQVIQNGAFTRFNGQVQKYDNLKNSQLGLGITQMIEVLDFATIPNDLFNFPKCLDQE